MVLNEFNPYKCFIFGIQIFINKFILSYHYQYYYHPSNTSLTSKDRLLRRLFISTFSVSILICFLRLLMSGIQFPLRSYAVGFARVSLPLMKGRLNIRNGKLSNP